MTMEGRKSIRGTREWAVAEINCCLGCPHGCRYCYARQAAVVEKALVAAEAWPACRVLPAEAARVHPLYPGQVMFPSAHDIVPENLEACLQVLHNLTAAGNRVLVVSKPHLACIRRLCEELRQVREQILFRFTITARDEALLARWEPGAPGYAERKACLAYAKGQGFATSVSVEPMLDTADVAAMVRELLPFVTHSIWLGKMNRIEARVMIDSTIMEEAVKRLADGQSDRHVFRVYNELRNIDKVRWKESIKEVVGLELSKEAGLDR
jgi:DNA repair photolyase